MASSTAAWPNRRPLILAAVGAWLASAYWALLTALTFFAVVYGQASGFRAFLPFVLIVLYAVRGWGAYRGDDRALNSLVWLHGIGVVATAINSTTLGGIALALNAIKIAVNAFGAVTAFLGRRALQAPRP